MGKRRSKISPYIEYKLRYEKYERKGYAMKQDLLSQRDFNEFLELARGSGYNTEETILLTVRNSLSVSRMKQARAIRDIQESLGNKYTMTEIRQMGTESFDKEMWEVMSPMFAEWSARN